MHKPKISVLTPCFNSEKYIKATINSIIQQSYTNYEVIIQDSNSSDNTIDILKSFRDDRIKIFPEKAELDISAFRPGFKIPT